MGFSSLWRLRIIRWGSHSPSCLSVSEVRYSLSWGLIPCPIYHLGTVLTIGIATGVSQFFTKIFAFQWIFAFTIGAVLFVVSLLVAFPALVGRDELFARGEVVNEDRERAPLLADE